MIKGVKSINHLWLKSFYGKIEGRIVLEEKPNGRVWFIDAKELRLIKLEYMPTILPGILK